MLTSLRLRNFKNFADETLKLGPFTVIVGANASGKSNIRDAFRFLHGIGRGYTLAEIIGGKIGAGGQVEWESIRGEFNEVVRLGQRHPDGMGEFYTKIKLDSEGKQLAYSITVGIKPNVQDAFRLLSEMMLVGEKPVFGSLVSEPEWGFISEARPSLTRPLARDPLEMWPGTPILLRPSFS